MPLEGGARGDNGGSKTRAAGMGRHVRAQAGVRQDQYGGDAGGGGEEAIASPETEEPSLH